MHREIALCTAFATYKSPLALAETGGGQNHVAEGKSGGFKAIQADNAGYMVAQIMYQAGGCTAKQVVLQHQQGIDLSIFCACRELRQ